MNTDLAELIARRLEELAAEIRASSKQGLPVSTDASKCSDVDPQTEMLDATELASMLGVCPRTVRRWSLRNKLPNPTRVGTTLRWKRSTIETWTKARATWDAR